MPRTVDEIEIHSGEVRSFEWYWDEHSEMPGLDSFEDLDADGQAAVMASLEHWASLELGKRVSETRINEEHDDPKVLAVKGGKHRFAMFHAGDNNWIVCDYYSKQKGKLDNLGKGAVKRTIAKMKSYQQRVKAGEYYERD